MLLTEGRLWSVHCLKQLQIEKVSVLLKQFPRVVLGGGEGRQEGEGEWNYSLSLRRNQG